MIVALAGWSIPSAHAEPAGGGAKRFGACLASQKTGDLVLLFDESSSLQGTDPQAARVQAARYLLQTLGRYADRVGANLEVATSGFSDTYTREQDWTKLTGSTADQVGAQLSSIATKNTGIDTDYWLALDGARQELASRGPGPNGGQRCQAIAWFSDGKIDFTPRATSKPYADGITLDSPSGVEDTTKRAVESICRPGGVADQLRSSGIIMLGIGLGANKTPGDFDVMSAISTARGLNGMACGEITDPIPGDFYPVSNIDDMLFGFDALNPDPGTTGQGPVCQLRVCPEARHNFTLDRSIKSVDILGSGGVAGVVPYLISPSGKTLELPKKDGRNTADLDGVPVTYEWRSDSAQTISLQNTGGPQWAGSVGDRLRRHHRSTPRRRIAGQHPHHHRHLSGAYQRRQSAVAQRAGGQGPDVRSRRRVRASPCSRPTWPAPRPCRRRWRPTARRPSRCWIRWPRTTSPTRSTPT